MWVVVMGGHTAEVGWFRSKTDIFHNDIAIIDRTGQVRWRTPEVSSQLPPARELHSLTALSDGRLLLFGGESSVRRPHPPPPLRMLPRVHGVTAVLSGSALCHWGALCLYGRMMSHCCSFYHLWLWRRIWCLLVL